MLLLCVFLMIIMKVTSILSSTIPFDLHDITDVCNLELNHLMSFEYREHQSISSIYTAYFLGRQPSFAVELHARPTTSPLSRAMRQFLRKKYSVVEVNNRTPHTSTRLGAVVFPDDPQQCPFVAGEERQARPGQGLRQGSSDRIGTSLPSGARNGRS